MVDAEGVVVDSTRSPARSNKIKKVTKKSAQHDAFFKSAMKNKAIAVDFFCAHWGDLGFSKEVLAGFVPGNNEHQLVDLSKIQGDVVYIGKIGAQTYVCNVEHQSTPVKLMPLRMLRYSAALMCDYVEQGNKTLPIVLPLCLYHNRRRKYPYPTDIQGCLAKGRPEHKLPLQYAFRLVDLTVMSDEEISTHGHASMVEWLLRDSYLTGETWLYRAVELLKHPLFGKMRGDGFDSFKGAMTRYIINVNEGERKPQEVLELLIAAAPQEERIMLSTAEQLRQEGEQRGEHRKAMEIAKNLLAAKTSRELVKQATGLSDAEISKLVQ